MTNLQNVNWKKVNGLMPAIIQDFKSKKILMLGYMNPKALQKTIDEQIVTFFSRTKNKLWTKGETSGHTLEVKDMNLDCDNDTLLISAKPNGPTCHRGTVSCFDAPPQSLSSETIKSTLSEVDLGGEFTLSYLFELLKSRKQNLPEKSYATKLFTNPNIILQKLTEECKEVVETIEKNDSPQRVTEEACDLLFHLTALLVEKNIGAEEIYAELSKRNTSSYSHKNDHINRKS